MGKLGSLNLVIRCLAWACLLGIAFATLAPVEMRPSDGGSAKIQHLAAFAVAGLLFVLAYPRRPILIVVFVLGSAVALELLQLAVPGRHGRLDDLTSKSSGALLGLSVALAITQVEWGMWKRSPMSYLVYGAVVTLIVVLLVTPFWLALMTLD
jgi:hypothetical protein